MRRRLFLLIGLSLTVTGCGRDAAGLEDTTLAGSTEVTTPVSSAQEQSPGLRNGIYYPKEREAIVTQGVDPNICYGQNGWEKYLHYQDSIYTAVFADDYNVDEEGITLDPFFGSKIGTVYGNQATYWSVDGDELSRCTDEGSLYAVRGYDTAYVVCMVWEEQYESIPSFEPQLHVTFYKKLNDITLAYGRELFQDRMALGQAQQVLGVSQYEFGDTHEQWDWEKGVSVTEPEVQRFLAALYEAEFLSKAELYDIKDTKLKQDLSYTLVFRDANGFMQSIKLYQDGYVRVSDAIVARMDAELCNRAMDWMKAHQ